ncbi:putative short-chain dehydrogenase/reductase (SDR) [Bradyrhizobium sp. STM 3843]|uniref:SDR family NAD(P)-dependent oxidoreductase n=1 Tax=Bradyrhizobium sp. STM 3843 TaxID=551947 RepID=UPI0002403759|nr:SDR family NAD(P)-dependent oxidoreductase [Bradyrhizobium sp. STM 3843]CCE11444.1 putative short-chain dehydrogenase/reductase (SDR) [Bradyrhizobium sp. STM 3843]
MPAYNIFRRGILKGTAAMTAFAVINQTTAQSAAPGRSDSGPRELRGQQVPEPPEGKSAGPIRPGRGSALSGKVAIVTGAARGIGRAIAVEMAANGADVVALDIAGPVSTASNAVPASPEDLAETVRQIMAYGRRGESIRADIRDIAALRAAADHVEQTYGKIDIVVADAAIQRWKPLLEMEDSDWRDVIDNNLNGTANTIRAFAPKMVARKQGRIIVLASMQGKHGTKDGSSYAASKWGILGLMKSAALEFGQYNITVNALIPGLVDTPLTRYDKRFSEAIGETGRQAPEHPSPQQAWDARAPTVALKVGWLQPDDISPAAVFLASDAAAMVTGAEYEVTGGDSAKNV